MLTSDELMLEDPKEMSLRSLHQEEEVHSEEEEASEDASKLTTLSKSQKKRLRKKKNQDTPSQDASTQNTVIPKKQPISSAQPRIQTSPEPTIPVRQLYPSNKFPEGQRMQYLFDGTKRETGAEFRDRERIQSSNYEDLRRAAEVHRQVRQWAQTWIQPGMTMMHITDTMEAKLAELIEKDGLIAGQAFPTGCSINHVAAHWTPNTGDTTVLGVDDVVKFDFGTHVRGHIIDCAWTMNFNPMFDPLREAVQAATEEGIRQAGIDVRLCDVGAAIQEVMESHEVEIKGKTYTVKSIRNLNGHTILPYTIHGGKSVPIVRGGEATKMEEGEQYAIETFGSTGRGLVMEDLECSHYMMKPNARSTVPIRTEKSRKFLTYIENNYSTLAFCRKWLDREGQNRHVLMLKECVESGAIDKYPPLCDIKTAYTAQYEHTILLRPTCKEVLSRGDDY